MNSASNKKGFGSVLRALSNGIRLKLSGKRGNFLVELAIVTPLLLGLAFGTFELTRRIYFYEQIANLSRGLTLAAARECGPFESDSTEMQTCLDGVTAQNMAVARHILPGFQTRGLLMATIYKDATPWTASAQDGEIDTPGATDVPLAAQYNYSSSGTAHINSHFRLNTRAIDSEFLQIYNLKPFVAYGEVYYFHTPGPWYKIATLLSQTAAGTAATRQEYYDATIY